MVAKQCIADVVLWVYGLLFEQNCILIVPMEWHCKEIFLRLVSLHSVHLTIIVMKTSKECGVHAGHKAAKVFTQLQAWHSIDVRWVCMHQRQGRTVRQICCAGLNAAGSLHSDDRIAMAALLRDSPLAHQAAYQIS